MGRLKAWHRELPEKFIPKTLKNVQFLEECMNWPERPLVQGIFEQRLHRFGAYVRIKGRQEYCHVTNSGRLRELLYPGARVALVDHGAPSRTGRKTRYSVRLAYYRKHWVCIEANIAPKLLHEAWRYGLVSELKDYDRLQAEVHLDRHTRFDFQASNRKNGERAWIEVKCVTLVESKGLALFPDAPSERASKHLRELMTQLGKPKTKCFIFFIVQNPLGRAVGPKDDTDPIFGKTLRQAAKKGVQLLAYRAQVDPKAAQLIQKIPITLENTTKNKKVAP